jgi:predicted Zn-dependent peptidase
VEKATVEDVARVARKYLHKDRLAVLVVGNPGEIGEQLQKFGPVAKLDITIPPPPSAKAAAKSSAKPKARAKPRGSAAGEERKNRKQ